MGALTMRNRRFAIASIALLFSAAGALAQQAGGHAHASNGGQVQKIGKYEAELVVRGTELTLYLNDENDKPAEASSFAATALVLAKGNQQKAIELKPAGGNKLVGTGDFQFDDKVRATVTLLASGNEVGKARYSLDAKR